MTAPTWQEASTPVAAITYRDQLLASLEAEGETVNGWSDGAPQRAFVEGEARALAADSDIIAGLAATASPATCSVAGSTWVDAVIGWFDVQNSDGTTGRLLATQARWLVPLVISASAAPLTVDGSNASGIQLQAQNGAIYQCTQASAVTLNAASSFRGTLAFTARLAGITGNVTPGQITRVISGPAGLDVYSFGTQTRTLTARNDESDADLITRALGQWARLGGGWTRPAFDYLISFYGNTDTTSVTRWAVDDANPNGPGTVQVWLADAAGPASVDTVAAVDAGLNGIDVKPVGSGALTTSAATADALTINVIILTDGSNPTVGEQATAALESLSASFPLGPATLEPDLVSAISRGATLPSATIKIGSSTTVIPLNLAGFSSVIEVVSLDLVAPEILAPGTVLTVTAVVTVTS